MQTESRRIRLLQVAQRYSRVPTSGAELRIFHLATGLARHMQVTHLGFSPQPDACSSSADDAAEFVPVLRDSAYRIQDMAMGVWGRLPFPVLNYTRDTMRAEIRRRLQAEPFDLILLECVQLGEYLPLLRNLSSAPAPVVCDWHNIESEVLGRFVDGGLDPLRRSYAAHSARKLEAYERGFVNRCDLHIAVSERDRDTLLRMGTTRPIVIIENGVDAGRFAGAACSGPACARHRVLYVGAMDWYANVDAVIQFASESWPEIRRRLPHAVFTIVGRNPRKEVRALASRDGIEVTGSVADTAPYYREAFASVVPLRVGGGSRLKILESMAAGVAVVSTARGAEGLEVAPGVHYWLADDPREMSAAVVDLQAETATRGRVVAAAMQFVRDRYDWSILTERLAERLQQLLAEPAASR